MSCTTCREPNDPHWPAYHSCLAALEKRLADRIVKLEDVARRFEHMVEWQTAKVASEVEWERRVAKLEARAAPPDWTEQPDGMPIEPADKQTRANAMLEAARDYLAQDKSLDELMPSPWQVEHPAAAGPIPPGYKLAPGWSTVVPPAAMGGPLACIAESCYTDAVYYGRNGVCAEHAVEMGALVKVEPPAEQPASAADEVPCDCASRNSCPAHGCGGSGPSGEWFEGHEVVCDDCGVSLMVDSIEKCGAPNCLGESTFSVIPDESMSEEEQPPAPAQGAPAEPRSARMAPHGHDCPACGAPAGRCCWPMDGARKDGYHQERWNLCKPTETAKAPLGERMRATGLIIASAWADEVDALGARLAAAERSVDRHRLVLDEERRCYGILKAKLAAAERDRDFISREYEEMNQQRQRLCREVVERGEAVANAERERDEAKESAKAAWQQRDYAVAISDVMRCERDALRQGRPGPK